MRAGEILENRQPRSKPVTLKNLNNLKHSQRVRDEAERIRHELLMPVMYGDPDFRRDQLETERLELELELLRNQVNTETKSAAYDAIARMAKSGIGVAEKTEAQLPKLAHSGLGRKRKTAP